MLLRRLYVKRTGLEARLILMVIGGIIRVRGQHGTLVLSRHVLLLRNLTLSSLKKQ